MPKVDSSSMNQAIDLQNPSSGRLQNRDFAQGLELRTRKFAVGIVRLCGKLPNTSEGKVIRNQITRSGTSVGANYREANRSRSRADFKSRIKICESEASETQYWIEVIAETGWLTWSQVKNEYEECTELLAIFSTIGKNT